MTHTPTHSRRILVVDNYDSFVYTIVGYLHLLGATCEVVRADVVDVDALEKPRYAGVLVSPGPGTPARAGRSLDVVGACAEREIPMLGVCLGHQALAEYYGGTIVHAPQLMHGKTSEVSHDGSGVFAGLPTPFIATRYHSLVLDPRTVPDVLRVVATTDDGAIMGVMHQRLPLYGVQFHPESVLTEHGHRLLAQWLSFCGLDEAVAASAGLAPRLGR